MSMRKELLKAQIEKDINGKKDVYGILRKLLELVHMIDSELERHEINHNEPIINECLEVIVGQLERKA